MAVMETNQLFKTQIAQKKHQLTKEEIEKLKKISLEILLDVIAVCEELEIPYMLGGGTALGAVRHKGFIPWDDDVDLNVPRKYIDALLEEIKHRFGNKYSLDVPCVTEGYLSSFIQIHKNGTVFREFLAQDIERCGVKIDIFPIENTYNNQFKRTIHGFFCEAGLFLLSCYRMFAWRKEYKLLAKGTPKAEVLVRVKGAIGMLLAPAHNFWYRRIQQLFQQCKDETSQYVVIPSGRGHFFHELYERTRFMELTTMEFEKIPMKITKDYDGYLTKLYGNYMEIPKAEKREHHVIYELKI